jgi:hypothetical protein
MTKTDLEKGDEHKKSKTEQGGAGDDPAPDDAVFARVRRQNEAYERNLRLRVWEIGVPALATLACVVCLYTCENCLVGVMLFCALLCCKDWVLVLVFVTSLILLLIRHPVDPGTMHHISNAAMELAKSQ